jgi:hypothetical protein
MADTYYRFIYDFEADEPESFERLALLFGHMKDSSLTLRSLQIGPLLSDCVVSDALGADEADHLGLYIP